MDPRSIYARCWKVEKVCNRRWFRLIGFKTGKPSDSSKVANKNHHKKIAKSQF